LLPAQCISACYLLIKWLEITATNFPYRQRFIEAEKAQPEGKMDIAEGGLVAGDYAGKLSIIERSAPFSWLAWSWFGNDVEHADWDMTTIIDSALGLTDRGFDIVLGKGGIVETIGATGATTEEEEVVEE
jgi:hypothetical protein